MAVRVIGVILVALFAVVVNVKEDAVGDGARDGVNDDATVEAAEALVLPHLSESIVNAFVSWNRIIFS